MSDKEELIASIELWASPGMVDRKILAQKGIRELQLILAAAVEHFQEEQEDKVLVEQAERAVQRTVHEMQMAKLTEPQRRAEAAAIAKRNKAVFVDAARRLKFSLCEANYSLLLGLDSELDFYRISSLVTAGIALAPPSVAELAEWQRLDIEEHNTRLLNASPLELKSIARQEAEQKRTQARQEHVQQQIQVREVMDASQGYPPLPLTNQDGTALNAAFFLRLSNTDMALYKNYCKKYGFAQITKALNERKGA